ncbi:hypothetical protein BDZ97DRAFT_1925139 [Flammula alnicola]|nr:hypothetical protein BDZ97DRAFT_1925139 [Flammula alnicola]
MAVTLDDGSQCMAEICLDPNYSPRVKRQVTSTMPIYRKDLPNAQRLARGLPLKPPTRRTSSVIAARQAQPSSVPSTTYTVVIQVMSGSSSLGYVATDPNYWTPLLVPSTSDALHLSFSLPVGATSGSQLDLTMGDASGSLFGLVEGRDSTSADIGTGNFNYLYLDPVSPLGSPPGSRPADIPSKFSTASGLNKLAESSVWNVDLVAEALTAQWINTDGTSPATDFFVQSNHLYAGGDANAFHSRFPAPVTSVTLNLVQVL